MDRKMSFTFLAVLILAAFALSSTASAGLVGWWKFDETSGATAADSSGQGNDGRVVGTAQWVAGKIDGALQFNGSTYVDCGNKPSLNVRDQITISFWFKVEAFVNTWEAFLAKGDGAYRSSRSNGTGNSVHMGITGSNYFDATTVVTDNQWHHYCGTYDGALAVIYVDGVVDASRQYTGQIGDSSSYNLYIGENAQATGRLLHGALDDVRIYDKALNEQQILDLISKGISPTWNKAFKPTPADGTIGVGAPLFTWGKGDTAMFHNVYLGTSPDLTEADLKATRWPATTYYYVQGLLPGTTYYWRVDEVEKDAVTTHTGDVWSFVSQAVTAYYPQPADGANTASISPTLTWMAGAGAVGHHVYFGDDLDAVTQGAAATDKGASDLDNTAFTPETLESLKAYYWRVDEAVVGGTVKTGSVWKFTTAQAVDDFESYTDDPGNEIFSTWVDGYSTGLNGSMVGYAAAPFAEQTIVHGGLQSMPFDYNNVKDPFYSEAEQEFGTAQNWTANGIDTLVLFVQGKLTNSAAPLYVAIEDASKNSAVAVCPDPAIVSARKWTEWKIPLSNFTGVNLGKVKKLYIGVGDRQNPVKGGLGLIYIDDICLAKP
jgi:hypothetical protein